MIVAIDLAQPCRKDTQQLLITNMYRLSRLIRDIAELDMLCRPVLLELYQHIIIEDRCPTSWQRDRDLIDRTIGIITHLPIDQKQSPEIPQHIARICCHNRVMEAIDQRLWLWRDTSLSIAIANKLSIMHDLTRDMIRVVEISKICTIYLWIAVKVCTSLLLCSIKILIDPYRIDDRLYAQCHRHQRRSYESYDRIHLIADLIEHD